MQMFVVGKAEARVAFMPPSGIRCDRVAERSAQVAELVDAYVSGAYVARRAGSSPVLGTEIFEFSSRKAAPPKKNV